MDQLIPSLAILVEPFRDCFHLTVFSSANGGAFPWRKRRLCRHERATFPGDSGTIGDLASQ